MPEYHSTVQAMDAYFDKVIIDHVEQERTKKRIRARLANPVDTSGHANLETYIWACKNDCVTGWNFVTQRYEH